MKPLRMIMGYGITALFGVFLMINIKILCDLGSALEVISFESQVPINYASISGWVVKKHFKYVIYIVVKIIM